MTRHIEVKHQGLEYDCKHCEYKSTIKQSVKRHELIEHKAMYNCTQCSLLTNSEDNLNSHIEGKHSVAAHSCSECAYTCTNKNNLRRHVETKHTDVRYPCPQCTWTTKFQGQLLRHTEMKHEGVVNNCKDCDYK